MNRWVWLACVLFWACVVGLLNAAPRYVSASGTGSWDQSLTIGTPCSTRVAFDSAIAGDTVLFRGGTYTVPPKNFGSVYVGYYNPRNSGTPGVPIVFMAYPGETPLFDGTTGGWGDTTSVNHGVFPYATIFGTNNKSWIVFDGFSFQADGGAKMGRVILGIAYGDYNGNGNTVIKNCILNGGNPVDADFNDNMEVLRVEGSKNVTISNCIMYNCRSALYPGAGASGYKSYHDTNVVIENCEVYNCDIALFLKSQTPFATLRNNFIHDCNKGIYFTPNSSAMNTDSLWAYNNLIINNIEEGFVYTGAGSSAGTHGDGIHVYDNTFYNNGASTGIPQINMGYCTPGGYGSDIYNNIIIAPYAQSVTFYWDGGGTWHNWIKACDHNQWGATFRTILNKRGYQPTSYTTLAAWQLSGTLEQSINYGCGASYNPGCGDLQSDPLFVNTSGNFNMIADFALQAGSPCNGAGRGGDTIGCDVAQVGTENIYVPPDSFTVTISQTGGGTVTLLPHASVEVGETVFVSKSAATLFCGSGIDTIAIDHDSLHPVVFGRCYADTTSFTFRESPEITGRNFTVPIIAKSKCRIYAIYGSNILDSIDLNISDSSSLEVANGVSGNYIFREVSKP